MAPKADNGWGTAVEEVVASSALGRDLVADSRDAVYRACSYLEQKGVSGMPDQGVDSAGQWAIYGPQLAKWLQRQDVRVVIELIEGYPGFVETWSPYFE